MRLGARGVVAVPGIGEYLRKAGGLFAAAPACAAPRHEVHPLGATELPWQAPHVARVATSLLDFHSRIMVLPWIGLVRVETIAGRACPARSHPRGRRALTTDRDA